jgi:hypothetical protein
VLAGGDQIHDGVIDRLGLTQFMQINCQPEKCSPNIHFSALFSPTDGQKSGYLDGLKPRIVVISGILYGIFINRRYG